jgi:Zn-dependent protease
MRDLNSWSLPIGQLFGITIRVHLMLPLLMIGLIGRVMWSDDYAPGTWQDAAMVLAFMFISVLLHEFGHCFAARFMDGDADEILMWPLGGLAYSKSLPNTPIAHFVFTLGGPLVNLVICAIVGLVLYFVFDKIPPLSPFWSPLRSFHRDAEGVGVEMWVFLRSPANQAAFEKSLHILALARLFWVNWILLLFNTLLIGIPFDGGRMLQASLWPRLGQYLSTKVAIYAGYVVMVIIGVYAIIDKEPIMAFLAVFIFLACSQELQALEVEREESLFGDFSQGYTSLEKDEEEEQPQPQAKSQNFIQRWLAERAAKKEQEEQEQREAEDKRMDELLEKIKKYGKGSLTDEEQRFLKHVSDRYKNKP